MEEMDPDPFMDMLIRMVCRGRSRNCRGRLILMDPRVAPSGCG